MCATSCPRRAGGEPAGRGGDHARGHWSSYPPHKHDRDALPSESLLEETYYHRLNPPQGFALQRVYTDDRSLDETLAPSDGDVVLVPRGYHPVGAPHATSSTISM
jgi:5-deoxy-glucuronate isomerase